MDELRKCPFCGGEAKATDNNCAWSKGTCENMIRHYAADVSCSNCGMVRFHALEPTIEMAREKAAAAWNRRHEPANEPLTLEELRGMQEPVWVRDLLIERCSDWHFVVEHNGEIRLFNRIAIARKIVGYDATTGHNYGKTWLAYIMIYEKGSAPRNTRLLQRWVNNKLIFRSTERFEDYDPRRG